MVPEKFSSKIVLRQKNARKFKRLFHFYQLIPLDTQKNVWRLRHDSTYVTNCRTLKESRKICCRVLGFHRLITSEHSTHTHTHTPRCSTFAPRFFVYGFGFVVEFWVHIDWPHPNVPHTHHDARRPPHDISFLSFPGIIFRDSFWFVIMFVFISLFLIYYFDRFCSVDIYNNVIEQCITLQIYF